MLNTIFNYDIVMSTIEDYENYGINVTEIENVFKTVDSSIDLIDNLITLLRNGDYHNFIIRIFEYVKIIIFGDMVYDNKIMYTFIVLLILLFVTNTICTSDFRPDIKYTNIILSGIMLYVFINVYTSISQTLLSVYEIMKTVLPIHIGTSMISNSNPALRSVLAFFVSGFHLLCNSVLLPAIFMSAVFCVIVSAGDIRYLKSNSLILSSVNWIIGIYTSLHIMFIKLVGMNHSAKNGLFYEGFRYTVSKGIPIVGNYVSDTLTTFVSGLKTVNDSLGYTVSILLIANSFMPIISALICGLVLKVLSYVCSAFVNESSSKLINTMSVCLIELAVVLILCVVGFMGCFTLDFI